MVLGKEEVRVAEVVVEVSAGRLVDVLGDEVDEVQRDRGAWRAIRVQTDVVKRGDVRFKGVEEQFLVGPGEVPGTVWTVIPRKGASSLPKLNSTNEPHMLA